MNTCYPGTQPEPLYNPDTPLELNIGPVYPNKLIYISGIPTPDACRFTINIENDDDDVAFHFDVRHNYGGCDHVIVRNTKKCGSWGCEERECCDYPFEEDKFFEMLILVEPKCYKVSVNNRHLLDYEHRLHLVGKSDKLIIKGDIRLTQVKIQN